MPRAFALLLQLHLLLVAVLLFGLFPKDTHATHYLAERIVISPRWLLPRWTYDLPNDRIFAPTDFGDLLLVDLSNDIAYIHSRLNVSIVSVCMGGDSDTLFVLDFSDYHNRELNIHKLDLNTKSLSLVVIDGIHLNDSSDIAFHNNMLYIADTGSQRILKVPATGGAVTEMARGVYPVAIDVDSLGNIFFNDHNNNDYTYNSSVKWIIANSPDNQIAVLDNDVQYLQSVLFVDRSKSPNEIYYGDSSPVLKKARFVGNEILGIVIEDFAKEANHINKRWYSFPPILKVSLRMSQVVITKEGVLYYLQSEGADQRRSLMKLIPTSDVTLASIVGIFFLVAIIPCIVIGCGVFLVDIIIVLRDLCNRSKHPPQPVSNSSNSNNNNITEDPLQGLDDVSLLRDTTNPTPTAVKTPTVIVSLLSNLQKPPAYTIISAVRNVYYVIVAIMWAILTYSLIALFISTENDSLNCTGSSCGLIGLAMFIVFIGIVFFSLHWAAFFWSPIYFLSSFLRADPYISDTIVVGITQCWNCVWLVLSLLIAVPSLFMGAIVISLPSLGFALITFIAIVLDTIFIIVLRKVKVQMKKITVKSPPAPPVEASSEMSVL